VTKTPEQEARETIDKMLRQSDKYKTGLPEDLPAWYRPLPFCYQSTGVETRFTNDLDPDPVMFFRFINQKPLKSG